MTVKLFAGLRERAGWSSRELDGVAAVSDVWARLDLGEEPAGLLYAVNKAYAEPDTALADGDEVALIPPVSGGDFRLSEEPLDLAACVAEVKSDEAGAIATFTGTTRISSRGRTVAHLEYEAYPGMAEQVMAEIADELRARHELIAVAIHHRIGTRLDRRAERRDRRLRRAPRPRTRRLPRGDRPAQGARPAVEERGLRGRRGVDRARVITS